MYNLQQQSAVESSVELFEKDLAIMNIFCRQLAQNDNFRKLAAKRAINESFISIGKVIQKQLNRDSYIETLLPIEEMFCYFPNSQYILSPNYLIKGEDYYKNIKSFDENNYESFLEVLTSTDYVNHFISMDNWTSDTSVKNYLYIIDANEFYYLNVNCFVCFIFSEEQLNMAFNNIEETHNIDILLSSDKIDTFESINTNNFIVLGRHVKDNFSDIVSTNNVSPDSYYTHNFNGSSYTIGSLISDNTGFLYYYRFPTFNESNSLNTKKNLYLFLIVLSSFIGGILIRFFSKNNIQPIIELGQELDQAVEAQNNLQNIMDTQRPIMCTSYVRRLFSGTVTEDEVSYISSFLELGNSNEYYNGMYVCVYDNSKGASEINNFDSIVQEGLNNYLSSKYSMYSFSPSERTYAILLKCSQDEEPDFILKVSDSIVQLHDYLLDNFGIWLFAGIGKNTDNLMNVWESYQQAIEAVSYTSKNYIFYPYEFIKKDSNAFYYPPEISTKLIHFITAGNKTQVMELFSLIHQENIEERSLPINLVKFLLSDIRNTLLKARFALPQGIAASKIEDLDNRFNEHVSFKLCEDIALTLCDMFSSEGKDSSLIATIEKYIMDNYMDPSLGLNKISDEFQMSESYFSHMFKEKTGVNFSVYLENKRLGEAARLITETDTSLNELYMTVGYNNANTFRRAFKKVYEVTPSAMRESASNRKTGHRDS